LRSISKNIQINGIIFILIGMSNKGFEELRIQVAK
jgi:hypothetical protein